MWFFKQTKRKDQQYGQEPQPDSDCSFETSDDAMTKTDEPEIGERYAAPGTATTEEGTPLDKENGAPRGVPDDLSECTEEEDEQQAEEDEDKPKKPVTGVPCPVWAMLALGAVAGGLGAAAPASTAGPPAVWVNLLREAPSPTDKFFPNPNDMVLCSQDPSCSIVMDGLGPVIPPGTLALFDIPGTCQSKSRDWLRVGKDILEFKAERIRQRYAFSMLFCETDGGNWLENAMWMSDLHECDWYNRIGLDPCNRYEEMEIVRINDNGLQGTLPAELAILSTMYEFTASDNLVTGTLPMELAACSDLDTFCIAFNLLEGPLPGFIFRFPEVVYLDIAYNKFTGSIPTDLPARTPELQIFFMENNEISGPIPDNLGELNLRRLHMDDNKLTGTVPSSFGNAPRLEQLYLHNNDLQGTITGKLINNEVLMSATFQGNQKMSMENVDELNEVCEKLVYSGAGKLSGFTVDCLDTPCNCCECYGA